MWRVERNHPPWRHHRGHRGSARVASVAALLSCTANACENSSLAAGIDQTHRRRVNGPAAVLKTAANLLNAIQYVRLMAYVDQLTRCNTCTAAFSGNHPYRVWMEQERLRGFFPALTDTCKVGDHAAPVSRRASRYGPAQCRKRTLSGIALGAV